MLLHAAGPYIQIQIRLFCGVNMTHMTHMSCRSMLQNAANHRNYTAPRPTNLPEQVTGIHLHVLQMCAPRVFLPSFSVCHP